MNENYKKVNVLTYVKEGIKSGRLIPRVAEKFTRIYAVRGTIGEEVISWSVDQMGKPIQEKVATVKNDTDYVVTKLDENGNVVIDEHGHKNQWIIDGVTFEKKYEIDSSMEGVYKPKGGPQIFVELSESIMIYQWGRDMIIAEGGYINITNPDDMYGISRRDFEDTYRFIDTDAKTKKQ